MYNAIAFAIGFVIGVIIVLIINSAKRKEAREIAQEFVTRTESQRNQEIEVILDRIRGSFSLLSNDALSKNTDTFLKLAKEVLSKQTAEGTQELETKKKLIDTTLEAIKNDLTTLQNTVCDFDKDRKQQFGELSSQLKSTAEQTSKLQETTAQLRTALASTKVRGQWGERMFSNPLADRSAAHRSPEDVRRRRCGRRSASPCPGQRRPPPGNRA